MMERVVKKQRNKEVKESENVCVFACACVCKKGEMKESGERCYLLTHSPDFCKH